MSDVDAEAARHRADARAWAASGEASVAELGQRLTSAVSAAVFLRAPDPAAVIALLLLQGPTAEASEQGYANSVAGQLGRAGVTPEVTGKVSHWKRAHRGVQLVSMARRVAGFLLGGVESEEKALTTQLFANALLLRVREPLRLVELLMQQGAGPESAHGVKTRTEQQAHLDGLGVEEYNEHTQLPQAVKRAFAAAQLNELPLPSRPLFRLAYALKDASWDHRSDVALLMAVVLGRGEVDRWLHVGAMLGRGARACRARWFERWWSAEIVASLQYPSLEISLRPQRFLGKPRGQPGEQGEEGEEGGGGDAALKAKLKLRVSACEAAQAKRTLLQKIDLEEDSLREGRDTSEDEEFVRQLQARFEKETRLRKQGWNAAKFEAAYSSVQPANILWYGTVWYGTGRAAYYNVALAALITKHWTPAGELKPPAKGSQDGNDRPFAADWHLLPQEAQLRNPGGLGRYPPGVAAAARPPAMPVDAAGRFVASGPTGVDAWGGAKVMDFGRGRRVLLSQAEFYRNQDGMVECRMADEEEEEACCDGYESEEEEEGAEEAETRRQEEVKWRAKCEEEAETRRQEKDKTRVAREDAWRVAREDAWDASPPTSAAWLCCPRFYTVYGCQPPEEDEYEYWEDWTPPRRLEEAEEDEAAWCTVIERDEATPAQMQRWEARRRKWGERGEMPLADRERKAQHFAQRSTLSTLDEDEDENASEVFDRIRVRARDRKGWTGKGAGPAGGPPRAFFDEWVREFTAYDVAHQQADRVRDDAVKEAFAALAESKGWVIWPNPEGHWPVPTGCHDGNWHPLREEHQRQLLAGESSAEGRTLPLSLRAKKVKDALKALKLEVGARVTSLIRKGKVEPYEVGTVAGVAAHSNELVIVEFEGKGRVELLGSQIHAPPPPCDQDIAAKENAVTVARVAAEEKGGLADADTKEVNALKMEVASYLRKKNAAKEEEDFDEAKAAQTQLRRMEAALKAREAADDLAASRETREKVEALGGKAQQLEKERIGREQRAAAQRGGNALLIDMFKAADTLGVRARGSNRRSFTP